MSIDTPAWVRDAVFYQIFPDRFASSVRVRKPGRLEAWDAPPSHFGFKGGDLLGVVERLDHIASTGANAIYLNPIFSSASNHRYHTYDYLAVDPLLGGDAALRELLDAAHARGMRVILDGVFNHASRGFWPFHHVLETGAGSPYRDWFHYDHEWLESGRPLRAYASDAELAAAAAHAGSGRSAVSRLGYDAWWGMPALPKLNTDSPDVREYLFRVAEHWIRFGADGWRLDVPLEIRDEGFWREFRRRVRAIDPEAYLLAEVWHEGPEYLQGDQYDAFMNYPLTYAIIGFTGGPHVDLRVAAQQNEYRQNVRALDALAFAERLDHVLGVNHPDVTAVQFNLLGSHDTPRFRSLVGGDPGSMYLATLVQMTLPGAPSIYYGDEIGMAGEHDPDCRRSFPWDHPEVWDTALLAYIGRVATLRHAHRALRDGGYRRLAADGYVVAYLRMDEADAFVAAVNAGTSASEVAIEVPELVGRELLVEPIDGRAASVVVTAAGENDGGSSTGRFSVSLPPRTGALLRAGTAG
ncbi:MAG: glycoside hydrolase family 13 protein [Geodermatophilaceae bacterium]|nr:glycoside hydrolase family 13 protein [Geodermatophilaceae bacterium]